MPLLLIRHAQSVNNSLPEEQRTADPGLTELGRRQAGCLAARLAEWEPDVLLTSAFRRTLETTAAVADATGLRPEILVDLHEQGGCQEGPEPAVYVGQPGLSRQEILDEFGNWELPDAVDEQGWWKRKSWEKPEACEKRARWLAGELVQRFGDPTVKVAAITHGMFKPVLVSAFLGRPFVGNEWLGDLYNTSVSQLKVSAAGAVLDSYNDTAHLVREDLSA